MTKENKSAFFEMGFPLEKPDIILPWGILLSQVAKVSGGVWHNDRYAWNDVKYLNGLDYPLFSDNKNSYSSSKFTSITAYIGLTEKGWSDIAILNGYKETADHLINLFGDPHECDKNHEVPEANIIAWSFDSIALRLTVIEQHVYKCYLTVDSKIR